MEITRKRFTIMAALACVLALALVPALTAQADVSNGGFEAGAFTGWTVVNWAGSSGNWYIQTGATSPLNGFAVPAPPEGAFAAMTDQTGGGSHVLYQDIAVPPEGGTLSFYVYYYTQSAIATPASLDPFGAGPNQQYRVDLLSPAEAPFSLNVLQNLFATNVGDLTTLGPTLITADLSAYAGTTVRLRAAEADNQLFFNAGFDGVVFGSGGMVAGCDNYLPLTADSVVGTFVKDAQVYWEPGSPSPDLVIEAGKSYWVLGLDATGAYYKVILQCQPVWVAADTVGPNYDEVWQGRPLPTGVVN
ncbi:MAG: hypothetical protein JW910_23885 [Anaerolineae bacterium]|nr:hypothetical protein [Anaerolineae bacterium]